MPCDGAALRLLSPVLHEALALRADAVWTLFHVRIVLFSSLLYPSWEDVKREQRLQIVL